MKRFSHSEASALLRKLTLAVDDAISNPVPEHLDAARSDVLAEKARAESRLAAIKAQIDAATEPSELRHHHLWLAAALNARRKAGVYLMRLQDLLGRIAREERRRNIAASLADHVEFRDCFIDAAREQLPRETFDQIINMAHARMAARREGDAK